MKKIKILTSMLALTSVCSVIPAVASLTSCGSTSITLTCKEEPTFHQIWLQGKTSDLLAKGFALGDSLTISADNGWKIDDVPFYSGYFVKRFAWVLCAYGKGEKMVITRNCKNTPPSEFGLTDSSKITITLKEKGKYKDIQEQLDLVPITDVSKATSEASFANFRDSSENIPTLKSNQIYRGFSPLCDKAIYGNRREYTNKLAKEKSIGYDIDIADDDTRVSEYIQKAKDAGKLEKIQWISDLHDANKITSVKMSVDFSAKENKQKVVVVFKKLIEQLTNGNSVYIHCDEGKDRTGFIFMILDALSGASKQQLEDEFMLSFINEFGVKKDSQQYKTIKDVYYSAFLEELTENCLYPDKLDQCAEQFLVTCGLTVVEVTALETLIVNK